MRINGLWRLCEDGVTRPVLYGNLQLENGTRQAVEFLVDTGTDRTVFNGATVTEVDLTPIETEEVVTSLGGATETIMIETVIHLTRETGDTIALRGQFTAVTEAAGLEFNILGRDILDMFSVIIDRPGNVVCFLSQRHRYAISQDS
jgi:predicted aspartyl protease